MLRFQFFLPSERGKHTITYEFHKFLSGKTSIKVDDKEVFAIQSLAKTTVSKKMFQPVECTISSNRMMIKVSVTESAEMGFYLYQHDIYINDELMFQLTS